MGGDVPPRLIDDYNWADSSRDPSLEALSLTVVEPPDDGYLALLAPRERLPRDLMVSEALDTSVSVEDFAWGSVLVQTDTLEGWTVFVEPNGWATSDTDVLARLSKQGRAVNVFWNVNAVMSFAVAKEVSSSGSSIRCSTTSMTTGSPRRPCSRSESRVGSGRRASRCSTS